MEPKTPARATTAPETESPVERLREPAVRNLAIGLAVFLVTGLVLAMAIFLSWSHAAVALVVAVVAMGILWVLWRLGLQHQPYGFFLSLSLVCLAAATIPMTYGMVSFLRQYRPESTIATPAASPAPAPMAGVPLLAEKYPPPPFDPAKEAHVKLLRDARVQIGGQSYLILSGEIFPLVEQAGTDVLFRAGSETIALTTDVAQVVTPAPPPAESEPQRPPKTPEQTAALAAKTKAAQAQALRLYPALGIKDTRENQAFIVAYERLKVANPAFLEDPEWPLQLAKALAESQGWKREN